MLFFLLSYVAIVRSSSSNKRDWKQRMLQDIEDNAERFQVEKVIVSKEIREY